MFCKQVEASCTIKIILALFPPSIFSILALCTLSLLPTFDDDYSFATYSDKGYLLCASLSEKQEYRLPPSQYINQLYKTSAIAYEDVCFYLHFGVDFPAIIRALFLNAKHKKTLSGASTLTMQTARLLCGTQKRNYTQKLKESFYALLLEIIYTKEEIFSMYAANAPFGGNVVGIEGATFRYFSTPLEELTASQCAVLAILPNQPSLVSLGKRRAILEKKRNALLFKIFKYSHLNQEDYELATAEELPSSPHPLPFIAMHYHNLLKLKRTNESKAQHLADKMFSTSTRQLGKEKNSKQNTSIDRDLQLLIEKLCESHSSQLRLNFVHNMAVLVQEVATGNIKAYIGNTGFFASNGKNVYVNMVQARRSSGSLLKPFLYAGMLDRGMICPSSLLKDLPTQIHAYAPENNNGEYEGVIPANEALAKSLNVPFVRSLREYGIPQFLKLLKECGFTTLDRSPQEYGLPLILGGGEITLSEVCSAYRHLMLQAMADNSVELRKTKKDETDSQEIFPISQGAAYLTLEALTLGKRPHDYAVLQSLKKGQKIAWKTGTSDGFKDAWSIGLTKKYVVGVWAGNADGIGRPEIKSNIATLPLMFEIFDVLEQSTWIEKPNYALKPCRVCKHSHYSFSSFCSESEITEQPIAAAQPPSCPYCKRLCLSQDGNYQIEVGDTEGLERIENRFVLSPFEEYFYAKHHKEYVKVPPFYSNKKGEFEIVFPKSYDSISIPIEISGKRGAFIAKASHKNSDAKLYWDVDGIYLGETMRFHQMPITVKEGKHVLTLTDNTGTTKHIVFYVEE